MQIVQGAPSLPRIFKLSTKLAGFPQFARWHFLSLSTSILCDIATQGRETAAHTALCALLLSQNARLHPIPPEQPPY